VHQFDLNSQNTHLMLKVMATKKLFKKNNKKQHKK